MRRRGGRAGRMDVPRFRGWSCPKEKPMSDARTARAESIRALSIPAELLPGDGRFGSGPSRIRDAQMEVLAGLGRSVMGTDRKSGVEGKGVVVGGARVSPREGRRVRAR